LIPELVRHPLTTSGMLYDVAMPTNKTQKIGKVQIVLDKGDLTFAGDDEILVFPVSDIKNLIMTRKEELSFDHQDKTYFVFVKDPMLFFDALNCLNGGNN